MNRLTKNINKKVKKAEEQGYIYVLDINKEIQKINVPKNSFDCKHLCWTIGSESGLELGIFSCNYGKKQWLGWSLKKEELE